MCISIGFSIVSRIYENNGIVKVILLNFFWRGDCHIVVVKLVCAFWGVFFSFFFFRGGEGGRMFFVTCKNLRRYLLCFHMYGEVGIVISAMIRTKFASSYSWKIFGLLVLGVLENGYWSWCKVFLTPILLLLKVRIWQKRVCIFSLAFRFDLFSWNYVWMIVLNVYLLPHI